jgi:hypothetical protein
MKIKYYMQKKRFSTWQVAVLIAFALIGVSVMAYAAVYLPYQFNPGGTARSSEVNANFKALGDVMPQITQGDGITNSPFAYSPGALTRGQITVTAPGRGVITLFASGSVGFYSHTEGTLSWLHLAFSKTATSFGTVGITEFRLPASLPSFSMGPPAGNGCMVLPLSMVGTYGVPSAGTYTYYLNAWLEEAGPTAIVSGNLWALYTPS